MRIVNYCNPLELMVATILSAQCTDKQVNIVTTKLFEKYRQATDYTAVPSEELQNVRRIGLFRNKARAFKMPAGPSGPASWRSTTDHARAGGAGGVGRKTPT